MSEQERAETAMNESTRGWPEPAYLVRTPRLILRCYERADVRAVHEGVLSSFEAFRPFFYEWAAQEPLHVEARAAQIRGFRARFDQGEEFFYGAFDRESDAYVGGTGLHPRISRGGLEIGYWVVADRWGQGLASEMGAAMTRLAFERMGALRTELRISPRNARSLAIARKLGYREEARLRATGTRHEGAIEDQIIFGMLRAELAESPCAALEIEAEGFLPPP